MLVWTQLANRFISSWRLQPKQAERREVSYQGGSSPSSRKVYNILIETKDLAWAVQAAMQRRWSAASAADGSCDTDRPVTFLAALDSHRRG
eukprot:1215005-Amphidinium_carterae.1